MLYNVLKFILYPFIRFFWLKSIEGTESLPEEGPYILAANHQSFLDPLFISGVMKERLYYLAGEKFYKYAPIRFIMNNTKQIYVNRQAEDKSSVYIDARAHLECGHIVTIFPEGTRTRSGHIQKAHLGVARIALQNKVDIVPLVLVGPYTILPAGKFWPKFRKIVDLRILPTLRYVDIKGFSEEKIVHELLMPQIATVLGERYSDEA